MQTRDQEYAAKIFMQMQNEVKEDPSIDYKQYGSMAHKLPILIRTAGLAQALEFVNARGKQAHHLLLDHLAGVVLNDETANKEKLRVQSHTTDLGTYMILTRRTVAALLWYKRFAQSLLNVDASTATETQDEEHE